MTLNQLVKWLNWKSNLMLFIALLFTNNGFSCSMYKITHGGMTIMGSNEDAWRTSPHIWFENGTKFAIYGAAFTGSRFDGPDGYAPQSGMNEFGLSFSRLASYAPENKNIDLSNKKNIFNPSLYLKDILHRCKTVDEVRAYISQYNHSYFIEDVFIYIDKSGKYLIVEPYTMILGNKSSYVLSNFCPSITKKGDALKLDRYRKGIAFLKNNLDSTLNFCRALSDTMHVCREKIGDGTLLTSIWNLNNGTVNLYFYHQYKNTIYFNIKEELSKGNHSIEIQKLFPANAEFEKLKHYQTPKNNIKIMLFLIFSGILSLFSSVVFLIGYFKNKQRNNYAYIQLILFPIGLILFAYMFFLCTNSYVYYFSSPYKDPRSQLVSLLSYVPFLTLFIMIPFLFINIKIFKKSYWTSFYKWLFTVNNIVYMILIVFFIYWGFFNVFNK